MTSEAIDKKEIEVIEAKPEPNLALVLKGTHIITKEIYPMERHLL